MINSCLYYFRTLITERTIPGSLVIVTRRKKFETEFLIVQTEKRKKYSFVSGSLLPWENYYAGALRELKEEIGLEPENLNELPIIHQFTYTYLPGRIKSIQKIFWAKVKPSQEIKIPKGEIKTFLWLDYHQAKSILSFPELRETFMKVEKIIREE